MQFLFLNIAPDKIAYRRNPTRAGSLNSLFGFRPIGDRVEIINQIDLFKFRRRKQFFKLGIIIYAVRPELNQFVNIGIAKYGRSFFILFQILLFREQIPDNRVGGFTMISIWFIWVISNISIY